MYKAVVIFPLSMSMYPVEIASSCFSLIIGAEATCSPINRSAFLPDIRERKSKASACSSTWVPLPGNKTIGSSLEKDPGLLKEMAFAIKNSIVVEG